jgi:hypothetical protein
MGPIGQGLKAALVVADHPPVWDLARHLVLGGHLYHREAVADDCHHGVVRGLHGPEVLEYLATSSRLDQAEVGGPNHQASAVFGDMDQVLTIRETSGVVTQASGGTWRQGR